MLSSSADQKRQMKETKQKLLIMEQRLAKFKEETRLRAASRADKAQEKQSAFVETRLVAGHLGNVRLSDIRVSTRVLRYAMTVQTHGPLFNDINQEIDSDMVHHLDRNLNIGGEVKEVYDELVKTLSEDFLRFDMVSPFHICLFVAHLFW